MEKLIELLNEYTSHGPLYIRHSPKYKGIYAQVQEHFTVDIISKKFGFIEWLVQNLKINMDEVRKHGYITKTYDLDEPGEGYCYLDWILMLLSISDTPIEDLISYLK